MRRRTFLTSAFSIALAFAGAPGVALANDSMKITGPFAHENLAVYFVHGASSGGPVPLTLQEALAKGTAQVFETGQVSQLTVENTGEEELFIQAGDIVKGGQQDRVLTVSLLLPPKSGKVPIASFCVEQGRWSARGLEDVKRFASAKEALPSREAKLALKQAAAGIVEPPVEPAARPAGIVTGGLEPQQRAHRAPPRRDGQSEIWSRVAETQRKLSENLAAAVASPQSASSLQLTLENQKLNEARTGYVSTLQPKGVDGTDIIGVVVAINGRINSAEIYPGNGLFRKMWDKVLTAAATEAIGERAAPNGLAPAAGTVMEFLAEAEKAGAQERELPAKVKLETRMSDKSLYSAAHTPSGSVIHRSYIAR